MSNIDPNDLVFELAAISSLLELEIFELNDDKVNFFRDLQKIMFKLDREISKAIFEYEENSND